jgi:hypothetical protein
MPHRKPRTPGEEVMIGIRVHVNRGGNHVHFGVYAGEVNRTYGFCGLLTMRTEEYASFRDALENGNSLRFEEVVPDCRACGSPNIEPVETYGATGVVAPDGSQEYRLQRGTHCRACGVFEED